MTLLCLLGRHKWRYGKLKDDPTLKNYEHETMCNKSMRTCVKCDHKEVFWDGKYDSWAYLKLEMMWNNAHAFSESVRGIVREELKEEKEEDTR